MNKDKQFGIVGLAALLVVNIPSIKLFVGVTSVVNLFALLCLLGAAFARLYQNPRIVKNRDGYILLVGFWILVLLISIPEHLLLRSVESGHVSGTIKMLYTVVCMVAIVLSARAHDVHTFVMAQIGWGVFVAACFLLEIISYSNVTHLHYNTVTLPLALSILSTVAYWSESETLSFFTKALFSLIIATNLLALLNLFGRSPFIFTFTVILFFYIIKQKSIVQKLSSAVKATTYSLIAILSTLVSINWLGITINFHVFRRIAILLEGGQDSRIDIYTEAIGFILENPLGYGWGAYEQMSDLSPYPHNIILETGVTSGLIGMVLIISIFVFFINRTLVYYRSINKRLTLQSAYIASYLIFTFMVSYTIASSYMLFVSLCMTTAISLHDSK